MSQFIMSGIMNKRAISRWQHPRNPLLFLVISHSQAHNWSLQSQLSTRRSTSKDKMAWFSEVHWMQYMPGFLSGSLALTLEAELDCFVVAVPPSSLRIYVTSFGSYQSRPSAIYSEEVSEPQLSNTTSSPSTSSGLWANLPGYARVLKFRCRGKMHPFMFVLPIFSMKIRYSLWILDECSIYSKIHNQITNQANQTRSCQIPKLCLELQIPSNYLHLKPQLR
jgi:hypothetical protein